jgi:hypothetical protein
MSTLAAAAAAAPAAAAAAAASAAAAAPPPPSADDESRSHPAVASALPPGATALGAPSLSQPSAAGAAAAHAATSVVPSQTIGSPRSHAAAAASTAAAARSSKAPRVGRKAASSAAAAAPAASAGPAAARDRLSRSSSSASAPPSAWHKLQSDVVWKKLLAADADTLALLVRHYDSDSLLVLLNDASAPNVKKLAGRLHVEFSNKAAAVPLIAEACAEARADADGSSTASGSESRSDAELSFSSDAAASEPEEKKEPARRQQHRVQQAASRSRGGVAKTSSASNSRGRSFPDSDVLAALARLPERPPREAAPRSSNAHGSARGLGHRSRRKTATDSDSDGASQKRTRAKHRRARSPSSSDSESDTETSSESDLTSTDSSDSDYDQVRAHSPRRTYTSRGSTRHRNRVDNAMESAGAARPVASKMLRNILARGPSVHHVTRYDTTFKSERNRRECLALSKILDALLAGDIRLAKELAARRYSGVHLSDLSGDWNYCDVLEEVVDKQSYLSEDILQRVVKGVMRVEALDKSSTHVKSSSNARKRLGGVSSSSSALPVNFGSTARKRESQRGRARSSSRGPQGRTPSGAPAGAGKKPKSAARGGSDQE